MFGGCLVEYVEVMRMFVERCGSGMFVDPS